MTRNIMLLFLSDAKTNRDTGELSPARYQGVDSVCYTTNESSVKILVTGYPPDFEPHTLDQLFVFTSDKVCQPLCDISKKAAETRTSLELFKDDLRDLLPDIEHILVQQPYHEDDLSVLDMQQTIVDMAKKIQDYVAQYPQDDFVLHADCTGGFRHAIMMTLDVVRLMHYSQVEIGQLLYSEYKPGGIGRVQDIRSIYDLFDLTAGADEFVRFGSVEAINTYFKEKNLSPELSELVQSMKHFSDAIKVCHAGLFTEAITDLHLALRQFAQKKYDPSENEEIRLCDSLMHRLQGRIAQDYQELWPAASETENAEEEKPDPLKLIRWCLKHDYLQQAMTLYTETIPAVLTEKGLFTLTEWGHEQAAEQQESSDKRTLEFYAFSDYDPKCFENSKDPDKKKSKKKSRKEYYDSIQQAYDDELAGVLKKILKKYLPQKVFDAAAAQSQLEKDAAMIPKEHSKKWDDKKAVHLEVANLDSAASIFQVLQKIKKEPSVLQNQQALRNTPVLRRILQVYADSEQGAQKPLASCKYGSQKVKCLQNWLTSHASIKEIQRLFPDIRARLKVPRQCWLCEQGYASSNISLTDLAVICRDYDEIRDERNSSNHARTDGETTSQDIRAKISTSLDFLDGLLNN